MILFAFSGCGTKGPGPGGTNTVIGKIVVEAYNEDFSQLLQTYNAQDEDVFIIYGDDIAYGDKVRTSYDGSFEFPYLAPGSYKIYVYSEDSTLGLVNDDIAVVVEFEITGKRELIDLGTITTMNNNVDCNARVRGSVWYENYNSTWTTILDSFYIPEEQVFLSLIGNSTYESTRTIYDGSYEFDDLCIGDYEVWIYSQDSTGESPTGEVPVIDTISITKNNEIIYLPDLVKVD